MLKIEGKMAKSKYNWFLFQFYALISPILILIIPNSILTNYPVLQSFTNYMALVIPSIDVLSDASVLNEAFRLQLSLSWIIGIISVIYFSCYYLNVLNYFVKYKNKKMRSCLNDDEFEAIQYRYIQMVNGKFTNVILVVFIVFMIYFSMEFYTGEIIEASQRILNTKVLIQSRIGIIWFVFLTTSILFYALPIILWNVFISIYNNIAKDKCH
jgi:hypothetical protein